MVKRYNTRDAGTMLFVRQRLVKAGLPEKIQLTLPLLITESELKILEKAIGELGWENTVTLIDLREKITAYQQLKRHSISKKKRNPLFLFLGIFTPTLKKLMIDPQHPTHPLHLFERGDAPFGISLSLNEKTSLANGRMSFDLFLTGKHKPAAFLGNVQGLTGKAATDFYTRTGKFPIEYLIERFIHAFPKPNQLRALNPKYHAYMVNPIVKQAVARRLLMQGKITAYEQGEFAAWLERHPSDTTVAQKVATQVLEEVKRIRRTTPGIHNAAFKRAGFSVRDRDKKKTKWYRKK